MAGSNLLQRLREKLRRAQQEANEQRATADDLQSRLAAGEGVRRRTELDADEAPAIDISKQLLQSQKPPAKGTPVAKKVAAAAAQRARPSSRDALLAMGPGGSVFGPAPSHSDPRFQAAHDEPPAPFLTGAPQLVQPAVATARPAPRREFSLATPSPFGEPAPQGAGGGLATGSSLSVHDDDDRGEDSRRYTRPSSREALQTLFAGAYVGGSTSGHGDDRQGPYLTGAAMMLPPLAPPPPPAVPPARREFSLSTTPPFDPPPAAAPPTFDQPQQAWAGSMLTGAAGVLSFGPDQQAQEQQSQGWGFSLEGAPSLTPRSD